MRRSIFAPTPNLDRAAVHVAATLLHTLCRQAPAEGARRPCYNARVSRVLVLLSKTSYRDQAFAQAAAAVGVEMVAGTDRCHELAAEWSPELFPGLLRDSLALEFRDPDAAVAAIVAAARTRPFAAVIPTGDETAVLAARASAALGLRGNAITATEIARNKRRLRETLASAGVPGARFVVAPFDAEPDQIALPFPPPWVVKPLLLSASRGVIRADDRPSLRTAWARVRRLLETPELLHYDRDPARRELLIEQFVPGDEVAVEGLLVDGELRVLARFDKPDRLDGPFFEETIYVTPSRHPAALQRAIDETTAAAARAIGLREGPVHAELRLPASGPQVIEVAARSIGGLCARTLRFSLGGAGARSLEELLLLAALGREVAPIARRDEAAGVMMLPTPRGGILRRVDGVAEARAVPGIEDVVISLPLGEKLVPLPEGGVYPGFLFARGERPEQVEAALREAHGKLSFDVTPALA